MPGFGKDPAPHRLDLQLETVSSGEVKDGIKEMRKGHLQDATDAFNEALSKTFNSSSLQTLNALNYHLRALNGETAFFELAEQGYLTAIRADRSNWEARFYLGLLYVDMQRYAEAKTQLGAYVLHDDSDLEGLYYLAFASYYSGDVEAAHAAANRLWEVSAEVSAPDVSPEAILRMLTVVKAAAGEDEEAHEYLDRYLAASENGKYSDKLKRRLEDWRMVYDSVDSDGYGAQDDYGYGYGEESDDYYSQEDEFVDNKMVAVDVVIVRTEEDVSSATGVNLLSQLQFQFGNPLDGTPAYTEGNIRTRDRLDPLDQRPPVNTANGDIFDPRLNTNQETITNFISVPAVNYNLNILNAKDGVNEILARPTLVARAGQTSEFFSGVEVSAAAVSGGAGDSISVEKEIGVKLAVTPEFGPDGSIILQVEAERTFLTTPSSSVLFEFRLDTTKTTVNANVAMNYGQTLILGGLNERETENDSDGVPILRDIPLINLFFSRKTQRDFKKSVMILLTPRPASYMYTDPEESRASIEARSEAIRGQLQDRYQTWFQPLPNIRHVMRELQGGELYRNFQSGDIKANTWHDSGSHTARMKRVLERSPL